MEAELLEELLQVKRTLTAQHQVSTGLQRLQHYYIPGYQWKDVIFQRYAAARMHMYMYNTW